MPDEPTPWELHRSIERLRQDLSDAITRAEKHISTESLAAILGRYDEQLKSLNEDMAQERALRAADVTAVRDWGKSEHDRLEKWVREAVSRIEKAIQDTQTKEADRERERRADRRVVYGAALTAAAALALWILDKLPGGGT